MLDTQKISDRYIAELPYLMGYEPKESVVAFWLHADSTMSFAQRADISDVLEDTSNFVTVGDHNPRTAALILIYSDKTPSELWDFALELGDTIEENDITVFDILKVNGSEYSTFFLPRDDLDTQGVFTVDAKVISDIKNKYKDKEVGADRDSLMANYGCANSYPHFDERMESIVDFSDAVDDFIDAYEAYPDYSGSDYQFLVSLSVLLHNIKVRDEILIQINSLDREGIDRAIGLASEILRVTPKEHSAPIYTVTAIMAWIKGNGALANMLIDTALEATPDYNLAIIIQVALRTGLSPSYWREVISEL